MADEIGHVNSNYGWQWDRNGQLDKIIQMLQDNPDNRQCAISIYDGKEIDSYSRDTPCTYAVQFTILNGRLDMAVVMRSNDLWYGFCNDQYCFSMLQKMASDELKIEIGTYYHFAHNMHLYNDKIN
jgi:thymidylate synthase